MRKPTATYDAFDVVVVPFPFTDRAASKRRPALVVSPDSAFNRPSGHAVLAMITSQEHPLWPLDIPLTDLGSAGLTIRSLVRMKLFTVDQRLILRKAGKLSERDRGSVSRALSRLVPRT